MPKWQQLLFGCPYISKPSVPIYKDDKGRFVVKREDFDLWILKKRFPNLYSIMIDNVSVSHGAPRT